MQIAQKVRDMLLEESMLKVLREKRKVYLKKDAF